MRKITAVDKLSMIEFIAAQGRLTLHELRAMIMLIELYNNDTGDAWPSYSTIARCLEVERSTAVRIIARLVRKRYLEVDPAAGGNWVSNRYVPRWDAVVPGSSFMALAKQETGDARATSSRYKLVSPATPQVVSSDGQTGGNDTTKLVSPAPPKPSEKPFDGPSATPTAGGGAQATPPSGASASPHQDDDQGASPPDTPASGDTPDTPVDVDPTASLGGAPKSRPARRSTGGKPTTKKPTLEQTVEQYRAKFVAAGVMHAEGWIQDLLAGARDRATNNPAGYFATCCENTLRELRKASGNARIEQLEAAGMKQTEIARALGVTPPLVNQWKKSGGPAPTAAQLAKLEAIEPPGPKPETKPQAKPEPTPAELARQRAEHERREAEWRRQAAERAEAAKLERQAAEQKRQDNARASLSAMHELVIDGNELGQEAHDLLDELVELLGEVEAADQSNRCLPVPRLLSGLRQAVASAKANGAAS
jgi:transcriptional regulator with XRE-family HTH domain